MEFDKPEGLWQVIIEVVSSWLCYLWPCWRTWRRPSCSSESKSPDFTKKNLTSRRPELKMVVLLWIRRCHKLLIRIRRNFFYVLMKIHKFGNAVESSEFRKHRIYASNVRISIKRRLEQDSKNNISITKIGMTHLWNFRGSPNRKHEVGQRPLQPPGQELRGGGGTAICQGSRNTTFQVKVCRKGQNKCNVKRNWWQWFWRWKSMGGSYCWLLLSPGLHWHGRARTSRSWISLQGSPPNCRIGLHFNCISYNIH